MATATDQPPAGRLARLLPWLGFVLWAGGCAGLWYVGTRGTVVGRRALGPLTPGEFVLAGCVWLVVLAAFAHRAIRHMFGPVFVYEVVRLGRKRLTFALRLLYVLGVMALLVLFYLTWLEDQGYFYRGVTRVPHERLNEFATEFFLVFVVVQFCVVVFLTPAYVAGTVADEKQRKTLEFLLATDLRNREIVFGKLAARVTNLLMFVLAGLPVVAFLQLFGGIDPDLLLASIAATVVTVVGVSAVSVGFSVALRRPRDAIALAYLACAVYAAGSGLLGWTVFGFRTSLGFRAAASFELLGWTFDEAEVLDAVAVVTDGFAAGNVVYVVPKLFLTKGPGAPPLAPADVSTALFRYTVFWGFVTALLMTYSVLRLRATALHQSYGGAGKRRAREARARPPVGGDAMVWKEVFAEGGIRGGCLGQMVGLAVIGTIFAPVGLITYFVLIDPPFGTGRGLGYRWGEFQEAINVWVRVVTGSFGGLILLAAALRGAGVVSGERDRDTWVSLVATPLTTWEMLRGKWLGVVFGLRRMYALLILIWALALAVGAVHPGMIAAAAVFLAVYVSAFALVGIFCSITARNTLIASVKALMAALFLAGGFWLLLLFCCALPVGLVADNRAGRDFLQGGAQILAGWTPPFVLGWLPLNEFGRYDLAPFDASEDDGIGPASPVVGLFVWMVANLGLGAACFAAFRKAANRTLDDRPGSPPNPRRVPTARRLPPEEPSQTDAASPSA